MKKPKILGAYEKTCPICGGTTYKIRTAIGVIIQCKCGMCTTNNIHYSENKEALIKY